MNIFKLSFKNLFTRPMRSALTVIMLTMGVALASLLILVGGALDDSFRKNIRGIDMVVGAKGSPLQLILSAVYQIDNPTGNISQKEARKLASNRLVKEAIEISFGDSYKGRRIVGTSHAYVDLYDGTLQAGQLWERSFEAVVGSQVAIEFDLKMGEVFYSNHGTDGMGHEHEDHPFVIVGLLNPSGTVLDKLILTAPESIWDVHGDHNHGDHADHADHDHDEDREITAMLIKFRNKMGMMTLPRMVNQDTNMQAALPAIEVNRLFELFGVAISTLQIVALAIMLLGAISVFVSMINALKDRAFEMALMRSMGASRSQVFGMIMLEAVLLGIIGTVLGIILSHVGIGFLNEYANEEFGISIAIWHIDKLEWVLMAGTILLCIVAAILPAITTTRIDVSKILSSYEN